MLTPVEIWPMIAGSAVVVFGAGQLVEKIRNGKYVLKETCALMHKVDAIQLKRMEEDIQHIKNWVDSQSGGIS